MADGVTFNYWTFNGTVPGPFIRPWRRHDYIDVEESSFQHSSSQHWSPCSPGPGGGAVLRTSLQENQKPWRSKRWIPVSMSIRSPQCIATHDAHGMYGLILVEPERGLPKLTESFMSWGEFYSTGGLAKRGLAKIDAPKMLDGYPEYVVFNGKTKGLVGNMKANVGESVRIFIGNGGSQFHFVVSHHRRNFWYSFIRKPHWGCVV